MDIKFRIFSGAFALTVIVTMVSAAVLVVANAYLAVVDAAGVCR
jgi:hypothetical protein